MNPTPDRPAPAAAAAASDVCPNCATSLPAGAAFCPRCGQAQVEIRWNLLDWLHEALSTFFHFEGRTWTTIRDLGTPGRLQRNFVAGQRQRYLHPLRVLLLAVLLLFAAVNLLEDTAPSLVTIGTSRAPSDTAPDSDETLPTARSVAGGRTSKRDAGDHPPEPPPRAGGLTASPSSGSQSSDERNAADIGRVSAGADSAVRPTRAFTDENALFAHPALRELRAIDRLRTRVAVYEVLDARRDSLVAHYRIDDTATLRIADDLVAVVGSPDSVWSGEDTSTALLFGERYRLDAREIATSPEGGLPLRGLDSRINRLIVQRSFELFRNGNDSVREYLWNNATWAILAYVPLLALVYQLFYRRKQLYYAQHLVHVAIVVSAGLFVAFVGIALQGLTGDWIWTPLAIAIVGYAIACDRNFYATTYAAATLKAVGIGTLGILAFGLASAMYLIVALLAG